MDTQPTQDAAIFLGHLRCIRWWRYAEEWLLCIILLRKSHFRMTVTRRRCLGHLQILDAIPLDSATLACATTMCLTYSNLAHLSLAICVYASTGLAHSDSLVFLPVSESVIRRDASTTDISSSSVLTTDISSSSVSTTDISSSSVSLTNTVSTTSPPTSLSVTTITSTNLFSTGILSTGTSAAWPTSTNNLGYGYWFPQKYTDGWGQHAYNPTEYDSMLYMPNLYQSGGWIKLYSIQPDEDFPQIATQGITDLDNIHGLSLFGCIQSCTNANDGDDMQNGTYTGCTGVSLVQDTCFLKAGPMTTVNSTSSPGALSAVLHLVSYQT